MGDGWESWLRQWWLRVRDPSHDKRVYVRVPRPYHSLTHLDRPGVERRIPDGWSWVGFFWWATGVPFVRARLYGWVVLVVVVALVQLPAAGFVAMSVARSVARQFPTLAPFSEIASWEGPGTFVLGVLVALMGPWYSGPGFFVLDGPIDVARAIFDQDFSGFGLLPTAHWLLGSVVFGSLAVAVHFALSVWIGLRLNCWAVRAHQRSGWVAQAVVPASEVTAVRSGLNSNDSGSARETEGKEYIMAFTKVTLYHRERDKVCLAPVGFSWTTLFFGPFALIFRSPRAWILTLAVAALAAVTVTVSNIVFAFFANQLYIRTLIRKEFRMRDVPPDRLGEIASKLGISRSRLDTVYDWGDLAPASGDVASGGEYERIVERDEPETKDTNADLGWRPGLARRTGKVLLWVLGAAFVLFAALLVLGWIVGKNSSDEEARSKAPAMEAPAPGGPLTTARQPSEEGIAQGSQSAELSQVQQLASAAGFILGQDDRLDRIRKAHPNLETDVTMAEMAFAASFGRAVRSIEAALGDEQREAVRKEFRRRSIQMEVANKDIATAFIAEVEARARGEIESPFLEVLLAYQYKDAPHEEFANGNRRLFTSKQHPKAKGLEIELYLPRSWTRREGRRPNVVQFFAPRPAQGIGAVSLTVFDRAAYEARHGEPLSADAIRELEANAGSRAEIAELLEDMSLPFNEKTTIIEVKETTMDNLPAVMARQRVTSTVAGLTIQSYRHIYTIPYARHFIYLVVDLFKASGLSESEFDAMHERWRPLFLLIASSLVVQNQWW